MASLRYPTIFHYRVTQVRKMTNHQNLLVGPFKHDSIDGGTNMWTSARYQASMLRSLKEVQGDDNVVGFYQATTLGAFFNQTLVDTQAIHQERLRHGGVVIVHGDLISATGNWWRLIVRTDISQAARGNASFRAFRLTSSFMDAYKKGNFSSSRWGVHTLRLWSMDGLRFVA
jgi:translation initiation factor 3 subunit H